MLDVGLFDSETLEHIPVMNAAGNPVDVEITLGDITVTRPDAIQQNLSDALGSIEGFDLLEIDGLPEQALSGDELNMRWLWRANDTTSTELEARLVWLNEESEMLASAPFVPLVNGYPASLWQADDVWRGQHRVYVPGNLNSGLYTVAVQIDDTYITVGEMRVTTPERVYERPQVENALDAKWENGIALIGYDTSVTEVTLYWETGTQINTSLRLFVHVLDADERIVAQTDNVPVDWTRPTTGWAVSEFIVTVHDFADVALADYELRIGWYDPLTGDRTVLLNGDDSLVTALGD